MKVRPIHRPPRIPAYRMPHCRWKIFLDDEGTDYEQHPNLEINRKSKAATVAVPRPVRDAEPGGWPDYAGAFDPGFQLEDLSHGALVTVVREVGLQSHLLARAFHLSVSQRFGAEPAAEIAAEQWAGISALAAERLRTSLAIEGDGIDAVAKVFQMHPCFQPRAYVDLRVDVTSERRARLTLHDCPALEETDPYSWFSGLGEAPHPAARAVPARSAARGSALRVGRRDRRVSRTAEAARRARSREDQQGCRFPVRATPSATPVNARDDSPDRALRTSQQGWGSAVRCRAALPPLGPISQTA
jgi:hypothetical protein